MKEIKQRLSEVSTDLQKMEKTSRVELAKRLIEKAIELLK